MRREAERQLLVTSGCAASCPGGNPMPPHTLCPMRCFHAWPNGSGDGNGGGRGSGLLLDCGSLGTAAGPISEATTGPDQATGPEPTEGPGSTKGPGPAKGSAAQGPGTTWRVP